jgi:hypothetical protein
MAYINKSKTDDWATPKSLYEYLDRHYHFDFDPCPLQSTFDGLSIEWGDRNFVNPPYSKNVEFLKKGYQQYLKEKLSVFLIPSRTDTRYFHDYCMKGQEICFIKGRLHFGNEKFPAPFSSMLVIFDPFVKRRSPIITTLDQDNMNGDRQIKLEMIEA